ncbi:LOW QUALITY PROTEIN: hypothetical protein HID58_012116 [Brassica napus]|uniref:DNA-directed RNA polymerase RBP11-like dimerisation domain-containing protein n=1 Tax=Brassica napus TaxID=3708 RepID=A0ABQ8E059_BRANA|nr:LOW QUALITY PROTEIN: hypothetical protein HID58_012116 [Brassica napus]
MHLTSTSLDPLKFHIPDEKHNQENIPMKRYLYVEPKSSSSFYDTSSHSICKKASLLSHSSQLQPYSTCDMIRSRILSYLLLLQQHHIAFALRRCLNLHLRVLPNRNNISRHVDLNGTVLENTTSIERVSQEHLERVDVVEEHILDFFAVKIPRKPQQAVTNFPAREKRQRNNSGAKKRKKRGDKTLPSDWTSYMKDHGRPDPCLSLRTNDNETRSLHSSEEAKERLCGEDKRKISDQRMDAPERCERFVVPEGTKKFLYTLLFLSGLPQLCFLNIVTKMLCVSGCQLPHPLMYKIIVRVRTTNQSSPMQAYNQAINDLDKELDTLKNQFEMDYGISNATRQRWPSFRIISTKKSDPERTSPMGPSSGHCCQSFNPVVNPLLALPPPLPTITSPYSPSSDFSAVKVSEEFVRCFSIHSSSTGYISFVELSETLVVKLHLLLLLHHARSVQYAAAFLRVLRALVFQETFTAGCRATCAAKASASLSSLPPMNIMAMSMDAPGLHASSVCPNDLSTRIPIEHETISSSAKPQISCAMVINVDNASILRTVTPCPLRSSPYPLTAAVILSRISVTVLSVTVTESSLF